MYGAGLGVALAGLFRPSIYPVVGDRRVFDWVLVGVACVFASRLWLLRWPRATFHADRVEAPGLFGPSVLHRADISGVTPVTSGPAGASFEVRSVSATEPSLRLDADLLNDPIIADWFAKAPDADALALSAIMDDGRHGATRAERERRLAVTRITVLAFNLTAVAVAIWIGFGDVSGRLALDIALSSVAVGAAIVATSNGLVIGFGRAGARPMVVGALAPAVALALRAVSTVHLVDRHMLVEPAAVVGVAAAVIAFARSAGSMVNLQPSAIFGALAATVFYGAVVAADVGFDTAPARPFVSTVLDKQVRSGASTAYDLRLATGSGRPAESVAVSSATFWRAPVGSPVCLTRHPGVLGIAWFHVALCPVSTFLPKSTARSGGLATITNPDWIAKPTGDELADFYPAEAARLGKGGSAMVTCIVQADGFIGRCHVGAETPPGLGFGAASIRAASRLRMKPRTVNGRPVGDATVTIPFRWRPPT